VLRGRGEPEVSERGYYPPGIVSARALDCVGDPNAAMRYNTKCWETMDFCEGCEVSPFNRSAD